MRRFKVGRFLTVFILLTLLPLLAYFQYRWQGQVSQALRNQLQEQMRRAAGQFSEEFDREIGRVYENFQTTLPESKTVELRTEQLRSNYAELYQRWVQTASHPNLVSDIFLLPQYDLSLGTIEHFNPKTRKFEPIACPPELVGLLSLSGTKRALSVSVVRLGSGTGKLVQLAPAVDRKIPAIGIPIADKFAAGPEGNLDFLTAPSPAAEAVVKLNLEYIRNELLPGLAKKHLLNTDGTAAYNFAVIDSTQPKHLVSSDSGPVDPYARGDIAVPIFAASLLEYSHGLLAGLTELPNPVTDSTRQRRNRFSFQIERNAERLIAAGIDSTPSAWELVLTHQAGSLDAAVERARIRNLGLGFGILVLLAASMGLTLLSVQRERRLARQQMEFVSAVSHELRTPLAVICSAGENLADGVVQDSQQTMAYGALVRNEGRRLAEMVEQVLDFAGIQSGKNAYRFEPVHVRDVIDQALQTFDMQIQQSGIALEKRVTMNLPPVIADRSAMIRALQNLISNALKYGESGKWLSVRAQLSANQLNIVVEDHGTGISAADLPHIFEPFYRARAAVDSQIKGSGLGLALVKQIVEAHGAAVTVDSVSNRGSLFKITFPMTDAASPRVVAQSQSEDDQAYSAR